MLSTRQITPCLWFDDQAEEAAEFYTGIFKNSKVLSISRYGEAGRDVHGRPPGSVMTVAFELDGQAFTALNAELSLNLLRNLNVVLAEGRRIEPQFAKVREA